MESAESRVQAEGENRATPTGASAGPERDASGATADTHAPLNDLESASAPNEDWGRDAMEDDEPQAK